MKLSRRQITCPLPAQAHHAAGQLIAKTSPLAQIAFRSVRSIAHLSPHKPAPESSQGAVIIVAVLSSGQISHKAAKAPQDSDAKIVSRQGLKAGHQDEPSPPPSAKTAKAVATARQSDRQPMPARHWLPKMASPTAPLQLANRQ